jgi:hypothetical protein
MAEDGVACASHTALEVPQTVGDALVDDGRRALGEALGGMSEHEPPDPLGDGPSLNADGRLEGRLRRIEPESAAPVSPKEEPLELEERAPVRPSPPPGPYRAVPPDLRRRLAVRLVIAAALLGAVLLASGLLASKVRRGPGADTVHASTPLDSLLGGGPKAPVVIDSDPPGATVRVGSEKVGVTPWAGDNVWVGPTPVVVELPGYRAWRGTLQGGEEVHLNARLKR